MWKGLPFVSVLLLLTPLMVQTNPAAAQENLRARIKAQLQKRAHEENSEYRSCYCQKTSIAGIKCAVWRPKPGTQPHPLIIFSHGLHGINTQKIFLMKALAAAGYLVIAPNHQDAMGGTHGLSKPEVDLRSAAKWTDKTYIGRRDDIKKIIAALHNSPGWDSQIDWTNLALAGHSLGGYTVLGLAGAWPSWKLENVKAVLALSPYSEPFVAHKTLSELSIPVMYQTGTRDLGVAPFLKRPNGAFAQTAAPCYLVEFEKAGHFSFSNMNTDTQQKELINHYSIAFLNKFINHDSNALPEKKLAGVSLLHSK